MINLQKEQDESKSYSTVVNYPKSKQMDFLSQNDFLMTNSPAGIIIDKNDSVIQKFQFDKAGGFTESLPNNDGYYSAKV